MFLFIAAVAGYMLIRNKWKSRQYTFRSMGKRSVFIDIMTPHRRSIPLPGYVVEEGETIPGMIYYNNVKVDTTPVTVARRDGTTFRFVPGPIAFRGGVYKAEWTDGRSYEANAADVSWGAFLLRTKTENAAANAAVSLM